MYHIDLCLKINKILEEKGMSKHDFITKLQSMEPNINRLGKIPSSSSIYAYLNCTVAIPIDLVPYIAIVLDIDVCELCHS